MNAVTSHLLWISHDLRQWSLSSWKCVVIYCHVLADNHCLSTKLTTEQPVSSPVNVKLAERRHLLVKRVCSNPLFYCTSSKQDLITLNDRKQRPKRRDKYLRHPQQMMMVVTFTSTFRQTCQLHKNLTTIREDFLEQKNSYREHTLVYTQPKPLTTLEDCEAISCTTRFKKCGVKTGSRGQEHYN